MKSPVELYFSNGQNKKVIQTLLLEPGEVQSLVNADLSSFGAVKVPSTFKASKTFAGSVHSLLSESSGKRYVAEGNNLWEDAHNTYTSITTALDGSYVEGCDYAGWMYLCTDDGLKKKFLISDRSSYSDWGIDPPTVAPTTGGTSTDDYQTYYSYVAKYSDGSEYETDLSPEGYTSHVAVTGTATGGSTTTLVDSGASFNTTTAAGYKVVVTSAADGEEYVGYVKSATANTITLDDDWTGVYTCVSGDTYKVLGSTSWSVIPSSTNSEVTHKRLYRTDVSGDIKYVAEITNATTTYTDNIVDEDLTSADTFDRTGYYPPPDNIWTVLEHYRRFFLCVDGDYSHCIFYSSPEEPQAYVYDSDTSDYACYTDVFRKGEAVMGIASFGGDLFIASKRMWKRLVGSDPSYWALRPTLSNVGNLARYALVTTRYGVLHIWYDGIYLFNGYNSNRITGKNEPFFKSVNWDYASTIRSTFDGKVVRFFVPYGSATSPTRVFAIDLEAYPRIKCYEEDQGESMALFDANTNVTYYAKGTGYGTRTGSSTVAFELWSKSIPTAALIQLDGASQLNYEIDTGGEDVTLTVYHDGVAHGTTVTLNTTSQTRGFTSLPLKNSRTLSLKLTGNLTSAVTIFEPWIVGGNQ